MGILNEEEALREELNVKDIPKERRSYIKSRLKEIEKAKEESVKTAPDLSNLKNLSD